MQTRSLDVFSNLGLLSAVALLLADRLWTIGTRRGISSNSKNSGESARSHVCSDKIEFLELRTRVDAHGAELKELKTGQTVMMEILQEVKTDIAVLVERTGYNR